MIDDIFFEASFDLGALHYKCYVDGDGQVNADRSSNLKNKSVRSTKLRTLSQKFQECLKLDDFFTNRTCSQLNRFLFTLIQFNKKIQKWNTRVDSNCLLRLINKIFSIKITLLNLTGLENKIEEKENRQKALFAKVFTEEEMKKYLEENCESISGDLRTAKYIFLGDLHVDYTQREVRRVIFNHVLTLLPDGSTVTVLEEGIAFGESLFNQPQMMTKDHKWYELLKSGKVSIGGWDDMSLNHKDSENVIKRHELLKEIISNKGRKNNRTLLTQVKSLSVHADALKDLRDQVMISSAKKAGETAARVLCLAGSNHLIVPESPYRVSNFFNPGECAVIIPKQRVAITQRVVDRYIGSMGNARHV